MRNPYSETFEVLRDDWIIMNKKFLFLLVSCLLFSCTSIPDGIAPVNGFEKEKYLGKWYEIARLDHSFERGLQNVSAEYSLKEDGGISVLNRGFNVAEQSWTEANGKAYFVSEETVGHLKVSFFGPFYASYVIVDLDKENYQWSLVTGPDIDYLWILSRQPKLAPSIVERLTQKAKAAGFDVESLIYVNHDALETAVK